MCNHLCVYEDYELFIAKIKSEKFKLKDSLLECDDYDIPSIKEKIDLLDVLLEYGENVLKSKADRKIKFKKENRAYYKARI